MSGISEEQEFAELVQELYEDTPAGKLKPESGEATQLSNVSDMRARLTLKGHFGKIYAADWSWDSRKIASASQDGMILVWEALTGTKLCAVSLRSAWVMSCAFSPSGNLIASGGLDNVCSVFDITKTATKSPQCELDGHEGSVNEIVFVSENEVVTASGDHSLILWDIMTKSKKLVLDGHVGDVLGIASPEQRDVIASCSSDKLAKIWDCRSGKCVATFAGHDEDINSICFLSGGNIFATGSEDATIRIHDIRGKGALGVLALPAIEAGVTSLAFSNSGRVIYASYEDSNLSIWDVLTEERVAVFSAHDNQISQLGVNREGSAIYTASWDATLKIWA